MKVICLTGSASTGKTTVAKLLAKKLKARYVDVNEIIRKNKLYEKYDRKFKTYIVNLKKLNKILIALIKDSKENLVIDSHLSHYLPAKYVDLCIVTKCDLKTLKKRLKKRGYSKLKIRENLDAEILDTCLIEALERDHRVKIIDTSKSIKRLNIKI